MVIRKVFVALVFTMFVGGGVALPVSIDTSVGIQLSPQSALAKSHKEKKAKKEKKEKGDKASKRKNEEMEGVGKKGKGKGMEKGKRKKGNKV